MCEKQSNHWQCQHYLIRIKRKLRKEKKMELSAPVSQSVVKSICHCLIKKQNKNSCIIWKAGRAKWHKTTPANVPQKQQFSWNNITDLVAQHNIPTINLHSNFTLDIILELSGLFKQIKKFAHFRNSYLEFEPLNSKLSKFQLESIGAAHICETKCLSQSQTYIGSRQYII